MSVSHHLIWFGRYHSTNHYVCLRDTTPPSFFHLIKQHLHLQLELPSVWGYRHISCRESIGGVHFTVAPLAMKISMDLYPISRIADCFDLKMMGSKLQLECHSI